MKTLLCLLSLALLAGSALANPDRFTQIDSNKDNQISWQEFSAAMPQMKEAAFKAIDKDQNGQISRDEWNAFQTGHMQEVAKDAPKESAKPSIIPPKAN